MKKHKGWSYAPYRPLFVDCGDIYICRVVPTVDTIHFEWLPLEGADSYEVYYSLRGEESFSCAGMTEDTQYTICGLETAKEYEFYVTANGKKSRVRLARCGDCVDTAVNYLHPEDDVYAFSGRCLCSPSLVRHPDGFLLASMDIFKGQYPQNLTLIFRSDDEGKTWHYVSELFPCFWGKMFIYQNELYMLSVSTEYGDLLIGKSTDGGKTFTEPTVLLRGSNGKNGEAGVHKNPQPLVEYAGRIWSSLEWGAWRRGYHAAMVMSAPLGSDLLDPDSWSFSQPIKYDPEWKGLPEGPSTGNIEGNLVEMRGGLYNVMRYDMRQMKPCYGKILAYRVDTEHPENPLTFSHCIDFPANHSKFTIRFDEKRKKFYSIASRIIDEAHANCRNLLSLMVSEDAEHWELERDIFNMLDKDPQKHGLQYVDFLIEGDEIIYLCRTALNEPSSFHDSNYITFGRLKL